MVEIMTHLHQYVPTVSSSQERIISTGEIVKEESASIYPILVGGDQLTAARARAAIKGTVSRYIDKNRTGACGLGRNRRLLPHTELVFLVALCAPRISLSGLFTVVN